MSILVIGEKPSVSCELAKVLGAEKRKMDIWKAVVTWSAGVSDIWSA